MKQGSKKVLLIVPSQVIARGLEDIFANLGEFEVVGTMSDLSSSSETRLRNINADVIILDPIILDFESRAKGRAILSEFTDASVVALESVLSEEDSLKQYDETISIYDSPTAIIKKMRAALDTHQDAPKAEGEELSAREKEILVCVAKGMLNKEIADLYNISIYTVITHRKNITRKTGIKTVAGLTVYALLNNLIDVNSFE